MYLILPVVTDPPSWHFPGLAILEATPALFMSCLAQMALFQRTRLHAGANMRLSTMSFWSASPHFWQEPVQPTLLGDDVRLPLPWQYTLTGEPLYAALARVGLALVPRVWPWPLDWETDLLPNGANGYVRMTALQCHVALSTRSPVVELSWSGQLAGEGPSVRLMTSGLTEPQLLGVQRIVERWYAEQTTEEKTE